MRRRGANRDRPVVSRVIHDENDAAYAIAHKFCELVGITDFAVMVHDNEQAIEIENSSHVTLTARQMAEAGDMLNADVLITCHGPAVKFRLKEKA